MIDIVKVLAEHEGPHLEAKLADGGLPRSMWETYSSFANTFGGVILLGVAEDKKTKELTVHGVTHVEQMISDIWNTLNNRDKVSANILVDANVYPADFENRTLLVIEVPRADRHDRPVYIGHNVMTGTYRRNYEGDYRVGPAEVKAMLRDQADATADAMIVEDKIISCLNQESIHRYRILFNNLKPSHLWQQLDTEEFLLRIGAARISQMDGKIHPTLGGLIFFGNFMDIVDELPSYFLDYREHMIPNVRWSDRVSCSDGTWSGNVFDFYFKVVGRLTGNIRIPFRLEDGIIRDDDTSLHKALREALANCLIHADYYGRRGIVIDRDEERITFSNPGWFRLDIEEAIAGGISDARNSRIFNMFSLINVGERSGMGLCDMYAVWQAQGYPSPMLQQTADPDRTTLVLKIKPQQDEHKNEHDEHENEHETKNEFEIWLSRLSLTEREKEILTAIHGNTRISTKALAEACDISTSTVTRTIQKIKERGLLSRHGGVKGVWVLAKFSERNKEPL